MQMRLSSPGMQSRDSTKCMEDATSPQTKLSEGLINLLPPPISSRLHRGQLFNNVVSMYYRFSDGQRLDAVHWPSSTVGALELQSLGTQLSTKQSPKTKMGCRHGTKGLAQAEILSPIQKTAVWAPKTHCVGMRRSQCWFAVQLVGEFLAPQVLLLGIGCFFQSLSDLLPMQPAQLGLECKVRTLSRPKGTWELGLRTE